MIRDLFNKKIIAVACAVLLSAGGAAYAFISSPISVSANEEVQEETTTEVPIENESEENVTDPVVEDTYQVLGNFNNWMLGSGLYMAQDSSNPNVYTATIRLSAGEYEYQIVKNNSWDYIYSGADGFVNSNYPNLIIRVPEEMDVTFTLDLSDMTAKTNIDNEIDSRTDISASIVTLVSNTATYNGTVQNPDVVSVTLGTVTLDKDKDYKINDIEAKDAGIYTVEIVGEGEYKGIATAEYVIAKKSISNATAKVTSATYTGNTLKSSNYSLKIELNGKNVTLVKDTDYSVNAVSGKNVGSYAVKFKGLGNYMDSVNADFVIKPKKLSKDNITVQATSIFNGEAVTPEVTVKDGKKLTSVDYVVTYKNNDKIGTATVVVTGTGNYKGTVKTTFDIIPAAVEIDSAMNLEKNTIKITYGKVEGAKSYIVYYKKNGASKWSEIVTKKTTLKINQLKKGYKYKIKVVATAKSGKNTFVSSDSKVITVRIKK